MDLKSYLEEENRTPAAFARIAFVTPSTVHSILKEKPISLKVAIKVEVATKGLVTCKELLPSFVQEIKKLHSDRAAAQKARRNRM